MTHLFGSTAAKVITALALMLAVVGFVLWLKWDDSAQPKQEARSAKASAETAKQTAQTVIDRAESDASVDELVADTARQIDTLPPTQASQAARKAICSLPDYKGHPSCIK